MSVPILDSAVFLKNIFDAIPTSVFVVDQDVRIFYANGAASEMLDMDKNAFIFKKSGDVLHCVNAGVGCGRNAHCADCTIRHSVRRAGRGERIFREITTMLLLKDGAEQEVHFMVSAAHIQYLGQAFILLTLEDITELKTAKKAVEAAASKLLTITSVLGEGVYVLDAEGRVTYMNPEAERLLGWSQEELLGKHIHDIIHFQKADGTPLPASECPVMKTIQSNACFRTPEDVFTRKDGTIVPVSLVSTPITEQGRVTGSVAAFHDITGRKQAQEALESANELLEHRATTDILTGIYNRTKFQDILEAEMMRAQRRSTCLSIIMFDVDRFKRINDTYGHHGGDSVLKELSGLITEKLRKYDSFARWGGEEFILLTPEACLENAVQLADRLRASVENFRFSIADQVTCSFGVAEMIAGEPPETMIKRADEALYTAKNSGRNRVAPAYGPETEQP